MFLSKVSVVMAALAGVSQVNAFFRMECDPVTVDMVDSIVQPGICPSKHIHSVMGGSNFSPSCKGVDLVSSECTSCRVKGDGSAYWVPALYFKHKDGDFELVRQKEGMLVYYLPERGIGEGDTKEVTPFPDNFQMIAGDPSLRNFTIGVQGNEASRRQRGIGFNCLNYGGKPEDFLERRKMPTKDEMKNCVDGLRADIAFPSCWNGKDTDSHDHRSHVAYPVDVQGGACPPGFPKRITSILYETLWDVAPFSNKAGEFIWSNGDATGYGYHGDFVYGWDNKLFKTMMKDPTCTTLSSTGGQIEKCATFNGRLQSKAEMASCKIKEPFAKGIEFKKFKKFPGPNKVTYGPAPAEDDHNDEGSGKGGDYAPKPYDKPVEKPSAPAGGYDKPSVPEGGYDLPKDNGATNVNVNIPKVNNYEEPKPATTSCSAKVVTATAYETATVYVDPTPAAKPAGYARRRRHHHGKRSHGRRF